MLGGAVYEKYEIINDKFSYIKKKPGLQGWIRTKMILGISYDRKKNRMQIDIPYYVTHET